MWTGSGRGDIPAKITDTYNGDFNVFEEQLNTCINASTRWWQRRHAGQGAVDGKLATRADASNTKAITARSCKE